MEERRSLKCSQIGKEANQDRVNNPPLSGTTTTGRETGTGRMRRMGRRERKGGVSRREATPARRRD